MRNPYVAGRWVSGDRFYGREQVIDEVLHGFESRFWVVGNRRIGKTSLLKQLEHLTQNSVSKTRKVFGNPSGLETYLSLYWDIEGCHSMGDLGEALVDAVESAGEGLGSPSLAGQEVTDALHILSREVAKSGRRLLLLCDEGEALINVEKAEPRSLQRLRRAIHTDANIRLVLTSSKRLGLLDELCRDWVTSPLLHGFAVRYLGGLTDAAAENLICQTQQGTLVQVSPGLISEIQQMTGNHPYLIQLLCHRLWQEGGSLRPIEDGDLVVGESLARFFDIDFGHLSESERQILLLASEHGKVSDQELVTQLRLPTGRVGALSLALTELGYLRRVTDELAVGNGFLARWIEERRDELKQRQPGPVTDQAMLKIAEREEVDKIKRLANLMRQRKAAGEAPYVLVLGAGATLSSGCRAMSAVVQAVVGHYDLKQFFEIMDTLSETERYTRLQAFFQEPYPSPGYRYLAKLVKAGYFDVILSTNFDFLLENAFTEVGLKAEDVEVLVNGRESEAYILKALERRTPRIKLLKLHGDLKARNMAFTPEEIFEFSQKVERVLAKYLNGDVVIIGHEMRDDDINRCIRKDGGAIWYIHPEKPEVDSFIWRAMQVRPSRAISGEPAQFDRFCETLYKELIGDNLT
jgi:hypothetical protein